MSFLSKIKTGLRTGLKSGIALGVGMITAGLGFIGFGISVFAMSLGLIAVFAYALAIAAVFALCLLVFALVPSLRFSMSTDETIQGDWVPEEPQEVHRA